MNTPTEPKLPTPELQAEWDQHMREIDRKLRTLSRPRLFIVGVFVELLLLKEWVRSIPLRWVKWQAGK